MIKDEELKSTLNEAIDWAIAKKLDPYCGEQINEHGTACCILGAYNMMNGVEVAKGRFGCFIERDLNETQAAMGYNKSIAEGKTFDLIWATNDNCWRDGKNPTWEDIREAINENF